MNKTSYNVEDEQELFLLDSNGKEVGWYCYLVSVEETEVGLIVENNSGHTYEIQKSEYDSFRVGNCTCASSKWSQEDDE